MAQQEILKRLQQGNDPQDPPDPPDPPEGTRTDVALNEEETAQLNTLMQQISSMLNPDLGLPKDDQAKAAQIQQLIDMYVTFGFPVSKATEMANFQYNLILSDAKTKIEERDKKQQKISRRGTR